VVVLVMLGGSLVAVEEVVTSRLLETEDWLLEGIDVVVRTPLAVIDREVDCVSSGGWIRGHASARFKISCSIH
jgi:hypothetical protein